MTTAVGNFPARSYRRAVRSLMPARAAATCCVVPLCLSRIYTITSASFFMTLSSLLDVSAILRHLAEHCRKMAGLSYCQRRPGLWPFTNLSESAYDGSSKRGNHLHRSHRCAEKRGSMSRKKKEIWERLCTTYAAWSKRCRNRGSLARPYIDRLTNLSLWT